jgi:CspA family cold shock protein
MIFQGYVKWYEQEKGYGFITCNNRDIFVHESSLRESAIDTLRPNQKIYFEIQIDPRRKRESAIFLNFNYPE